MGSVLAYRYGLGSHGLWTGLAIALGLIIAGQYAYIYATIDWAEAARTARERALAKLEQRPADSAVTAAEIGGQEGDGQGLAVADSAKESDGRGLVLADSAKA